MRCIHLTHWGFVATIRDSRESMLSNAVKKPTHRPFAPEYALHPGTYKLDEPFKTPARSIQWRQVLVLIMLLCSFHNGSHLNQNPKAFLSISIHFYPSTIEVLWYQSRLMYPSIPWKFPSEERDASHLGPFCSSTSRHPETGRPKCCAESVRRLCTSSSSSSP